MAKRSRLSKRSRRADGAPGAETADAGPAGAETVATGPVGTDPPDGVRLVGTLRGHTGPVGQLSWSPDGRLLASPSRDTTVRIWDMPSGRHVHTITAHADGVRSAAFDRRGAMLATCGDGTTVNLWEVGSWRRLRSFKVRGCQTVTFSPVNDVLAVGGMEKIELFDARTSESLWEISGRRAYCVAFDPSGTLLAATGEDTQHLLNTATGESIATIAGPGDFMSALVFAPDGQLLASCGRDQTVRTWTRYGEPVRIMEGHTDFIHHISFLADGSLLASKSWDGTVRLWSTETWATVAVIPEPGRARWSPSLAFHPSLPLLAAVGSDPGSEEDDLIHLWELDPGRILSRPRPASVSYTSAKIVLLGESGVGKTGLGYRLASGTFKDHASTHGQQFWLLNELGLTRADGTECEAVLWDLAGQPDYRLIHALFLDDADVALVLFDPTRVEDPLQGVDYWLRQLGVAGGPSPSPASGGGPKAILVAARTDRGSSRLPPGEISRFCAERGIAAHIVTSALTGEGVEDLVALMRTAVHWDARPATVTTEVFKWIKTAVLELKESQGQEQGQPQEPGPVILTMADLRQRITQDGTSRQFTDPELLAAVGHLVNHGYVALLRTSRGETCVLLAPELLNNVAASIVLEARRNPQGLGSLEEHRVLAGDYAFPELSGLSADDRDVLLDSAVAMFLKHNICFRETDPLSSRVFLVFPELINLRQPAAQRDQPVETGTAYTVTGAVENVYASLVVLLGFTGVFARTAQWRDQAEYLVGDSLVCGFRLEGERDGELDFALYFGSNVGEPIRTLFQSLFESFLARRDLTVRRFEPVVCRNGHQLNPAIVREQLAEGNDTAFCSRCGDQVTLPKSDAPIRLTRDQSAELAAGRQTAGQRSRFEQALFRLKTYVRELAGPEPTCFISYAWGNPVYDRWVERELASDLARAGITVILDRWENSRIGASVPRFLDRIERADKVVVVGTSLYRTKYDNDQPMGAFVVAAEGDLVGKRMIGSEARKATVLPVLLDGTEETALPPLLQGRVYGDFRQPKRYFLTAFDLILSVHEIPPADLLIADLRELIGSDES